MALLVLERADEAIAVLHEALDAGAMNADLFCELGSLELGRKEFAPAERNLRVALAIDPDYTPALLTLGNLLRERNRQAEAIASYRHAIAVQPKYVEAHVLLGKAIRDSGAKAEAAQQFREALQFAPDHQEARQGLDEIEGIAKPQASPAAKSP